MSLNPTENSEFLTEIYNELKTRNLNLEFGVLSENAMNTRKLLFDWLLLVNSKIGFGNECLTLTFDIIDAYLLKRTHDIDSEDFFLLALSAHRIASKFEEVKFLSLEATVRELCHENFDEKDLIYSEKLILRTIKFMVKKNYFNDFVHILIENIFKNCSTSISCNSSSTLSCMLISKSSKTPN